MFTLDIHTQFSGCRSPRNCVLSKIWSQGATGAPCVVPTGEELSLPWYDGWIGSSGLLLLKQLLWRSQVTQPERVGDLNWTNGRQVQAEVSGQILPPFPQSPCIYSSQFYLKNMSWRWEHECTWWEDVTGSVIQLSHLLFLTHSSFPFTLPSWNCSFHSGIIK